ncbi:hypothetical protein COY62_03380 [bacterium (Candidatus Howlettbacteria) CG_4_10_14_0_8_um_filter_40_9]|nr:MAG: hypothetical protein COY62_03380 [bacterium (Candidatus Howlettbacteria) CG_4_10_14_0_8_um_filter_40_9]
MRLSVLNDKFFLSFTYLVACRKLFVTFWHQKVREIFLDSRLHGNDKEKRGCQKVERDFDSGQARMTKNIARHSLLKSAFSVMLDTCKTLF